MVGEGGSIYTIYLSISAVCQMKAPEGLEAKLSGQNTLTGVCLCLPAQRGNMHSLRPRRSGK